MTTKEIAERLGISESTVTADLRNGLSKLRANHTAYYLWTVLSDGRERVSHNIGTVIRDVAFSDVNPNR
jgi:DNA-binding NarL/FixJ family response regulator